MAGMEAATPWENLKDRIESFVLGLRHPVLTEPGRDVFDLAASHYSLSTEYNKLLWHVWNDQANLVRQITEIRKETPTRMELQFQKFGKGSPGTLVISESRAAPEQTARRGQRKRFAQQLRRVLGQLFPEWKVEDLSVEPDHTHSLSGRYVRAVLRRGKQAWAVIGCSEQEDASASDGILTYGLIWLDWLRQNRARCALTGLKVFVPADRAQAVLPRVAWLNTAVAQFEVYETGEEIRRCDPFDLGNLKTSLGSGDWPRPPAQPGWSERIESLGPEIQRQSSADGTSYWAVRGLPVARESSRGIVFGIGQAETPLTEETFTEFNRLVRKLILWRSPDATDRNHPFYRMWPERWMQSQIIGQVEKLGFDLVPGLVHEQVAAMSGMERGIMDLLAIDSQGRLVVVELKASESIHLPLQALDYWMRVNWRHQQGEFEQKGYFEGRQLNPSPPLLLLVSPALQIHEACSTVLRYFSRSIEVVQIGLNENWRDHVQVVYRSRPLASQRA